MKRLILFSFLLAGLSSCSSSSEDGEGGESAQNSKVGKEYSLNQINPFEWNDDDVQKATNGTIEGGKRSRYDKVGSSKYAQKGAASYLNKSYTKEAWKGGKNYNTGSYRTGSFGSSGKQSRFSNQRSGENSQVARASGQNYSTGSYRSGSAQETGRSTRTGSSGYIDNRRDNYGWIPTVYSRDDHRRMSMGEAKSLLSR